MELEKFRAWRRRGSDGRVWMWYRVDGCRGIFEVGWGGRWRERAFRGIRVTGLRFVGIRDGACGIEKFIAQCRSC